MDTKGKLYPLLYLAALLLLMMVLWLMSSFRGVQADGGQAIPERG